MRLKGRVALVTGMAMGIGQSIAELFAAEGASIIGIDIQVKEGNAVAEGILAKGVQCLFLGGDVSSESSVRDLVQTGTEKFGKIDVLVNVAGIASENPVDRLDLAEWERILRINLTSVYLLSKYVLPSMLRHGSGSIVHISSVQGLLGFPG